MSKPLITVITAIQILLILARNVDQDTSSPKGTNHQLKFMSLVK